MLSHALACSFEVQSADSVRTFGKVNRDANAFNQVPSKADSQRATEPKGANTCKKKLRNRWYDVLFLPAIYMCIAPGAPKHWYNPNILRYMLMHDAGCMIWCQVTLCTIYIYMHLNLRHHAYTPKTTSLPLSHPRPPRSTTTLASRG